MEILQEIWRSCRRGSVPGISLCICLEERYDSEEHLLRSLSSLDAGLYAEAEKTLFSRIRGIERIRME